MFDVSINNPYFKVRTEVLGYWCYTILYLLSGFFLFLETTKSFSTNYDCVRFKNQQ